MTKNSTLCAESAFRMSDNKDIFRKLLDRIGGVIYV